MEILIVQNISLQMDYKIIFVFGSTRHVYHSYQRSKVLLRKSTAMSEESIKNPPSSGNSITPNLIDNYPIEKVKFNRNCLRQDMISFIHKNVINLYICFELDIWSRKRLKHRFQNILQLVT